MEYRLPDSNDEKAIAQYLQECFLHGEHEVILGQDLLLSNYDAWLEMIQHNASIGNGDWGRSLLYLCYEESVLIGILCVRYELAAELEKLYGNIGYSVRPSERNKGYAKQMLRHALQVCKEHGMESVRIGCRSSNVASAAVIQRCGGALVNTRTEADGVESCYYEIMLQERQLPVYGIP